MKKSRYEINEPRLSPVDLKTIHEATISIPNSGSMTIDQLRNHIKELEKALLELEHINQVITQEIKKQWGLK